MREYLGKTVDNGVLNYTSVSQIKMFDPRTKGGCPQRYYRRYVMGMKEAEAEKSKEAKDKGTALDRELKNYLATGSMALSGLAMKGLHILEKPGSDIGLDIKIHTVANFIPRVDGTLVPFGPVDADAGKPPPGVIVRITSQLTAAGIPLVGELDLAHARGHYRDNDGEYHADPPGTVEVGDIKFKTNATDRQGNSNLFLPTDMIRDVQMAGYGEWVSRVRPDTKNLRLSMLYYCEKEGNKVGKAVKVTRLHVIDDAHKKWAMVDSTVREMKDTVREPNIDHVPGAGTLDTCHAYGGCVHMEICPAYARNSLNKLYGTGVKIAEDHAANNPTGWHVPQPQPYRQEAPVGLISSNPQMMNQQPTTVQNQAPQGQPDMRATLEAEAAQQRQQVAQQQQQMPQPLNTAQLAEVCTRLGTYGCGFPALGGNAAQAFALLNGQQAPQGARYQGVMAPAGARRSLHTIELLEVAHIIQVEAELAAERAKEQPAPIVQQAPPPIVQQVAQQAPVSFLPPDAPQSRPELAMQQPQGFTPQQAQGTPAPEQQNFVPPVVQPEAPPEAPRRKGGPGRPKKVPPAPIAVETAPVQQAPLQPGYAPTVAQPAMQMPMSPSTLTSVQAVINEYYPPAEPQGEIVAGLILVNTRSSKNDTTSLNEYVDYINRTLSARYCVGADGRPGIQDVRCAPKGSGLDYGGWQGAVRETVKKDPPPPGRYHLDTFMDALNEAVADGLRVYADANGWDYFRGVRG